MRVIAAIAAGLILVGCGLQTGTAGGHGGSPTTSTTPSVPVSRQVRCVHLKASPASSGQRTVTLTHADNHGSFCVRRGTGIFVFLHELTRVLWAPIQSSSAAVEHRPSGVMSLIRGETGGFFVAAKVGTANLTSFEPRCPNGPHPGVHTRARCAAPLRFRVTVHVLG